MSPKENLTIIQIAESIFTYLNSNSKTITDIKNESGFHHNTIKTYLELIEFIQSQPKLILERTGHSYQAKIDDKK
jgi:hypothetical protein